MPRRRLVDGDDMRKRVAQLGARHDGVDEPVLEGKLGALKTLGQLLLDRIADDPLARKPDKRARLR